MSVLMGWHFFYAISAGIIKNINLKNINVVCKKGNIGVTTENIFPRH